MQRRALLAASALLPMAAQAQGFTPQNPECIAPAAPGGGFDLTCRLTTRMLNETGIVAQPIRTQNMPGGIGAVAINHINAQRRADANVIVAVSTGSWVNMAQGRFGRFGENDVRWIGAIGADYGVIAVRKDSRFNTLADAETVLAEAPDVVIVATGGLPHTEVLQSGNDLVVSAWDILGGEVQPGRNVLLFDDAGDHAADQHRPPARDRGDQPQALAGAARRADGGRDAARL